MALSTDGVASQMRDCWVREDQPKSTGQYSSHQIVFARLFPNQAQSSVLEEQDIVAIKYHCFGQLAQLAFAKHVWGVSSVFYASAANAGECPS